MERGRKTKVIAILALVVAVVGMSLGFAAFSNILTISSSATVTPSDDDFKMVVYGIGEDVVYDVDVTGYSKLPIDQTLFNSLTISKPFVSDKGVANTAPEATLALIDNEKDKVTNLTVNFTEPGQIVNYVFLVKNEGLYNAYINASDYARYFNGIAHTCTAGEGTTVSLVEELCADIIFYLNPLFPEKNDLILGDLTDSYKISPGEYLRLNFQFIYKGSVRPDGPVSISVEDFTAIYTTVPTGNVINE